MAIKLNIMENEKHPLDDLKNDEITEKRGKRRNAHCKTCNIARKLTITENEKYNTLGHEIWRGKLKKVENLEMSTVGRGIWQEN